MLKMKTEKIRNGEKGMVVVGRNEYRYCVI